MRLAELALLYAVVGVACAAGLARTAPAGAKPGLVDALLCAGAWPLYVPVWVAGRAAAGAPPAAAGELCGAIGREHAALVESLRAVPDPLVASLLPTREQLDRLVSHLYALDARVAALDEVLASESFDAARAAEALRAAERQGRGAEQARLALESIERLARLRAKAAADRDDLLALCRRLRMQVTVLRFAGADAGEVRGLLAEIQGRVEGAGAALGPELEAPPPPPLGPGGAA
ncbi:MAG TPA: hypothetical protein VFS43_43930 [Polyangiaceae bacterium]|nr:hypothetical protein [Polyangiaceae bacterium]